MTGITGASDPHVSSIGTSLSVQQQLYVLLQRSLKRADSLKLKRLVASNHLAIAKFDLTHVQRPLLSFGPKASIQLKTSPTNVCKQLRASSQLIYQFDNENTVMTIDGALSTSWLKNQQKEATSLVFPEESGSKSNCDTFYPWLQSSSVPGSVTQLVGSSYLVRATSWELYGSASLARTNALLYATCFADSSSSADLALAYGKLIQHLAVYKGYKEAFLALKIAEAKFLSVSKSGILPVKLQLLHERALHRGHLKLAQQICDELGVLASSVTGVDMEIKTEASLRRARTLLAANQFSEAASVAHSLFCKCYKFNMHVENATILLLLAEIHKRSGNGVLGIPYALASLSFCQSFNLDLLRASATLTLAELWLLLGSRHAKRALNLIHSAFPIILGQGGLELRSRAYIAEAKCYLSDSTISVSEHPDVVLDSLRQACEGLEALEYHELAAEAYYLMAIVLDKSGQIEEREDAASRFKQHIVALEDPVKPEDPLPNMLLSKLCEISYKRIRTNYSYEKSSYSLKLGEGVSMTNVTCKAHDLVEGKQDHPTDFSSIVGVVKESIKF
ncbi:anaphase-promoting complex subunit 5 isoform X1 [Tanacetum coccineum]